MHHGFFNDDRETMYLVMDLIEGDSLYDLLKTGPKIEETLIKKYMS